MINEDNLIKDMLKDYNFGKFQRFLIWSKLFFIWFKPSNGPKHTFYQLTPEINLYNPFMIILMIIFIIISIPVDIVIIFKSPRSLPNLLSDILMDYKEAFERCSDKKLYYNKKNVEYYKQKSMAYL